MAISNSDDVINSRDVIARIEELAAKIESDEISVDNSAEENTRGPGGEHVPDMVTCGECGKTWDDGLISDRTPAPSARCPYESLHEEIAELAALREMADEAEGYAADWRHGCALIRDSYFEDYARELAEDINGKSVRDAEWPFNCIDWEAAAEQLQADYTSVEFDGVTYWVR